ncbi:50S ribosomal protein L4 [Ahrensia sp. R2A130]|uniref:50S ribosomal protein L4 n=1 Tax=Ahrensia sp. R2A130 TaxID=744979 RepID=UPI0001E0A405|nr:50S ribosomal protein L4 [Ahrensia sp. R2A130]EFL90041.1 ribosomal protein, L4/L1 family [Ahrensia sp. R2A130]
MELDVTKMDGSKSGKVSLSDTVFGLEPRQDIIQRMVRYQLAKARQGTHQVQGRSDVDRTGKRMYRQKGTGGARHHSQAAPQFRGGGKAHGPQSRDHSHDLTKKFRALALRHALSAKAQAGTLVVVDDLAAKDPKTAALRGNLGKLGFENALMIGGSELDNNFKLAAQNIPHIDVLPVQGINVYDIIRRNTLVLSKAAVDALEERFK